MTVCIAAIGGKNSIVVTADQMVGMGAITADLPAMVKGTRIHARWFAMYAGNDISPVSPILQEMRDRLRSSPSPSLSEVASIFTGVYQAERRRVVEQTLLSPYSLDMSSYVALAAASTGNPMLEDIRREIETLAFDCTFLVAGFDDKNRPHIFVVSPPGAAEHYDNIGFWSIGSGAHSALSNLMFRGHYGYLNLGQVIYMVAESKFMAESAQGVGRRGTMMVFTADGKCAFLTNDVVNKIRDIWQAEGKAPMPPELDKRIDALYSLEPLGPVYEGA